LRALAARTPEGDLMFGKLGLEIPPTVLAIADEMID
jgi:hypothetical protein